MFYKLMCKFSEWLQNKLYDDYTYQELQDRALSLENQLDELQGELEYLRA